MYAKIRISMDGPDFTNEVTDRIALTNALRQLADKIDEELKLNYVTEYPITDSKGNYIGYCEITSNAQENDE